MIPRARKDAGHGLAPVFINVTGLRPGGHERFTTEARGAKELPGREQSATGVMKNYRGGTEARRECRGGNGLRRGGDERFTAEARGAESFFVPAAFSTILVSLPCKKIDDENSIPGYCHCLHQRSLQFHATLLFERAYGRDQGTQQPRF